MDGNYDMIAGDILKSNRDRFQPIELEDQFIPKDDDMEWIIVNDRLPDEKGEVIIYFTNKRGSFVTGDAFWNGTWFETISSFRDETMAYSGDEIVTHWMPLPEPPKT